MNLPCVPIEITDLRLWFEDYSIIKSNMFITALMYTKCYLFYLIKYYQLHQGRRNLLLEIKNIWLNYK